MARPTAARENGEGDSPEVGMKSATSSPPIRSNPNMEMDTNEEVINTNVISSPLGVNSAVNVGENHGESSSRLMCDLGPKNLDTFADGDPFLVKLQEIDRDLGKFDNLSSEKSGSTKLKNVEIEGFSSPLVQVF